jgi:hypothetical protein
MMESTGDEENPRISPISLSVGSPSDALAADRGLIVDARVTYVPLAVRKDFHWTCTVTSAAPSGAGSSGVV